MGPTDPCACQAPAASDIRPDANSLPNKPFWDRLDRMIQHANRKGLVVFLVGLIEPVDRYPSLSNLRPFARWVAARYSGNFVVFSPGFDDGTVSNGTCNWTLGSPDEAPGQSDNEIADLIEHVGEEIVATAPRHLVINHIGTNGQGANLNLSVSTTLNAMHGFHDEPWLAADMFQSGFPGKEVETITGRPRRLGRAVSGGDWRFLTPTKPAINGEGVYDHGYDPNSTQDGNSQFNRLRARQAGYFSRLTGAAGHSGGVAGIWDWGTCGSNPPGGVTPDWCGCGAEFPVGYRNFEDAMNRDSSRDMQRLGLRVGLGGGFAEQWRVEADSHPNEGNDRKSAFSRTSGSIQVYASWKDPITVDLQGLSIFVPPGGGLPTGTLLNPGASGPGVPVTATGVTGTVYSFPNPEGGNDLPGSADRLLHLIPAEPCIGQICWWAPTANNVDVQAVDSETEEHQVITSVVRGPAGAPIGDAFELSSPDQTTPSRPRWAPTPSGFGVVWENASEDLGEVWGRFLTADGTPDGAAFRLDAAAEGRQVGRPAVAASGDGRLLVSWEQRDIESGEVLLAGTWVDGHGQPDGLEILVTDATGMPREPRVACDASSVVPCWIVWESESRQTELEHVRAQKVSPSGELLGEPILVTQNRRDRLWTLMAVTSNEGFAVLWEAFDADDQSLGMLKRQFDTDGVPTGPEEWVP